MRKVSVRQTFHLIIKDINVSQQLVYLFRMNRDKAQWRVYVAGCLCDGGGKIVEDIKQLLGGIELCFVFVLILGMEEINPRQLCK